MKIKQIKIDGFGLHRAVDIPINKGLNVIYGNNEDGKSTIKSFISSILFGFKSRGNVKRYEPINGGTHGGSLIVSNDEGLEVEMSRLCIDNRSNPELVVTVINNPNTPIGAQELLRGVNQNVYDNVFSFGLEELQSLKNLTDQEVMDHIYTAGLGFANNSMSRIKKELNEVCDSLWKPRGKKGINAQLDTVAKLLEDKKTIQELEGKYTNNNERLEDIYKEMLHLAMKAEKLKKRELELDNLIKGLPIFRELDMAQKKAKELQVTGIYTEEDLNNLINLQDSLKSVQEELVDMDIQLAKIEQEKNAIALKHEVIVKEAEILALQKEGDMISAMNKFEAEQRVSLKNLQDKLENALTLVGDAIEIDKIMNFSITVEQRDSLVEKKSAYKEKEHELLLLNRELKDLEEEKDFSIKQRLKLGKDHDEEQIQREINEAKKHLQNTGGNGESKNLKWLMLISLLTILGIMAFMRYSPWLILAVATFGILFPMTDYLQNRQKAKRVSLSLVSREDFERKLLENEGLLVQLKDLKANEDKIDTRIQVKLDKIKVAEKFLLELSFEKDRVLKELGLKTGLSITIINEIIEHITHAKGYKKEINTLEGKLQSQHARSSEFAAKTGEICSQLGIKVGHLGPKEVLDQVDSLTNMLKVEKEKENQLQNLLHINMGDKVKHAKYVEKQNHIQQQIGTLLTKGESNSVAEYKEKYKLVKTKIGFQQQGENAMDKLRAIFSQEELDGILSYFKSVTPLQLEEEKEEVLRSLEHCNNQHQSLAEEKGKLLNELQIIEQKEDLDLLIHEEQQLQEEITTDVQKWCSAKLAIKLLDLAIKEYEEKTQPEVFKKAEVYLEQITEGKYLKILMRGEDKTILIVDKRGTAIKPDLLSRGTQEQLYICIRLGLIDDFCKKNGSVPVIFDDVFVNFDEKRTKAALEVIKNFACKHQVLFFTCHKHIVEYLNQNESNANTITL